MTPIEIKKALFQICFEKADTRHQKIKQTIANIDESLLEEDKSSAGDKHETGRAMLQIDWENATKQLHEVLAIKELLKKIDVKSTSDYARLGSLIKTNKGTYFLSLSIGAVVVDEKNYVCVAINSPIGQMFLGKKKQDTFNFNNSEYKILMVR